MSWRLAPSTAIAIGMPCASVSRLRLTPPLPRSVGLGPVFFPSQRRLRHCTVHRQPRPINLVKRIERQQPEAPELFEYPRLSPLLESSVRRTARTDSGSAQRVPLAPRAQYEQDGIHRSPVAHPWVVTAERMRLARRQKRFHLLPNLIWQTPAIVLLQHAHDSSPDHGLRGCRQNQL